jgi:hypothetical protein
MGWQAMDERDSWDGLTNGNVVARAAGVICPMAWMLLTDGTDASPDIGEWAARGLSRRAEGRRRQSDRSSRRGGDSKQDLRQVEGDSR